MLSLIRKAAPINYINMKFSELNLWFMLPDFEQVLNGGGVTWLRNDTVSGVIWQLRANFEDCFSRSPRWCADCDQSTQSNEGGFSCNVIRILSPVAVVTVRSVLGQFNVLSRQGISDTFLFFSFFFFCCFILYPRFFPH